MTDRIESISGSSSLIGGAISYEFPDCNISASATRTRVLELFSKDHRTINWYGLEDEIPQPIEVGLSPQRYDFPFYINGNPTTLIVGRRLVESSPTTVEPVVRKGILRRTVIIESEPQQDDVDVRPESPFLAIKVGADSFMKLATFDKDGPNDCPYAQIGDEMDKEGIIATSEDTEMERFAILEAMRFVVENANVQNKYGDWPRPEQLEMKAAVAKLQEFIDARTIQKQVELARLYEKQFVRQSFERLAEDGKPKKLIVLGSSEVPEITEYTTTQITDPTILEDGRQLSLHLVSEETEIGNQIQLMAVAGSGVALKVADLSSEFQSVDFVGVETGILGQEESRLLLIDLFYQKSRMPEDYEDIAKNMTADYRTSQLSAQDKEIAWYCHYGIGLLTLSNTAAEVNARGEVYDKCKDVNPAVKVKLEEYFTYPHNDNLPYPESGPFIRANRIALQANSLNRKLLDKLKVEKMFDEVVPEPIPQELLLMNFVAKLEQKGIVPSFFIMEQETGKTRGEIEVNATVAIDSSCYVLTLFGRPTDMKGDKPMRPMYSISLDPTKKQLGLTEESYTRFFTSGYAEEVTSYLAVLTSTGR